jgi:hypothetical protein
MSRILKGIFSVVAVSLTFGAVQLAFGQDLKSRFNSFVRAPQESVNRTVKADRLARASAASTATQTIAIHVDRLPKTSILVRIPAKEASTGAPAVIRVKDERKAASTFACEPVVSVLTDIARQLQPGRCLT